jgi:hypothetical protein
VINAPRRIHLGLACIAFSAACGGSPSSPTSSPPSAPRQVATASRLVYQVPAASNHLAASGDYTVANATFSGQVRTTCVPNPQIAGSVCPDLMVMVDPFEETFCQLWAFARSGERISVGRYDPADRPHAPSGGLSFNCAKGGTACNSSTGWFAVHEIESEPDGKVSRLHMTFEQTCTRGSSDKTPAGGKLTGELWIVNGGAS